MPSDSISAPTPFHLILSGTALSTNMDLRRLGLDTLHQVHTLLIGWETIFEVLGSVCWPAPSDPALYLTPPKSSTSRRHPTPLSYLQEKGYSALIKIVFQYMMLMCNSLSALSPEHLRLCISMLGQFGQQADTNIALTAAESLFWVSLMRYRRSGARQTTSQRTARPGCTSYWRFCACARTPGQRCVWVRYRH